MQGKLPLVMERSATLESWCQSFLGQGQQIKLENLRVTWEVS